MRKRLRHHTSPAMVVGLIALVVAMSGSAVAASLITGKQIKNGTIQRVDLSKKARASLKGPQGPQGAQGPKGDVGDPGPAAGPAGGALAGSYPNPGIADGAVTPSKLSPIEGWHIVGTAGEPEFLVDWANYFAAVYEPAAFRKDRDGQVHLRGGVMRPTDTGGSTVFSLPAGYRPQFKATFPVASTNGAGTARPGFIQVGPNGSVDVYADTDDRFVSLSGISFFTD